MIASLTLERVCQMSQPMSSRLGFISVLLTSLAFRSSPAGQTAYEVSTGDDRGLERARGALRSEFLPGLVAEYHGLSVASDDFVGSNSDRRAPRLNQARTDL